MGKICHLYCCWLFWLTLSGMTSGYKETSKGIRIDLIRQKTPREQYLNAPDLKKYGISFDWLYKKGDRVNDSIALYRYLDNEFYGQVVVGHPGQKMNVAFDTAWSLTWLISSECHWLKTVGCWFHNQYNHKKSSYYKPNGTKYIADEGKYNFTGYYSYENISIAHSNVTGFSFVEMNYVPFSFLFNKADGVMGLALRDEAGSYNPFFYTLLQQKKIKKALFSIYLNRDPRSSRGGNVMLGFYDPKHIHTTIYPNKSKIQDDITYLNVDPGQYWKFSVDKILITVNPKDFTVLCKNGCKAIVDSSSNRIDGPADEIAKIHNTINARPFIFNKWMVDCDSINDLPKIDFFLDGKEFRLSSKEYIVKMSLWSFTLCLSAFSPLETKPLQDIWVLGGAFLSQFYSIYDVDKKMIGFVRAA